MTLVGHELWGLPFVAVLGRSFTALHWAGATAAVVGIVAAFWLYRNFLPPPLAIIGTAAVAVLPTFVLLTTTYMTDLTGYAAELVCLAVGIAALRTSCRRPGMVLAISTLVGFWAFTCRESSIAAPFAVLAAHLLVRRARGRPLRGTILLGLFLMVGAASFYVWRKGLPYDQATPFSRPALGGLARAAFVLATSYFTVAIGVAPVLFLGSWRSVQSLLAARRERIVGGAVAALGAVLVALPHYPLGLPKNLFVDGAAISQFGAGGPQQSSLGGMREPLFPSSVWLLVNVVAVVSGALLAVIASRALPVAAVRRWPALIRDARPPASILLVLLYAGFNVVFVAARAITKGSLFDRYLIGLTTACGLLALVALRARGGVSVRRAVAALTVMGLFSLAVALDGDSYDRARWTAASQAVVTQRVQPDQVSAGFEWLGAHHRDPIAPSENLLGFPVRCVVIGMKRVSSPDLRLIATRHYAPVVGILERRFWVYREPRHCGPPTSVR
jgi:hypothetical protein